TQRRRKTIAVLYTTGNGHGTTGKDKLLCRRQARQSKRQAATTHQMMIKSAD
ncbi:Uncharacterized protein APZ42_003028, partial [Daphnia magna]